MLLSLEHFAVSVVACADAFVALDLVALYLNLHSHYAIAADLNFLHWTLLQVELKLMKKETTILKYLNKKVEMQICINILPIGSESTDP